ncbi:hypothetical protein B0T13DRAFT_303805 [Neurospora crassa]|nr:hypothetical protein B0T13DRAFT_303805 [Neurospora crassa]
MPRQPGHLSQPSYPPRSCSFWAMAVAGHTSGTCCLAAAITGNPANGVLSTTPHMEPNPSPARGVHPRPRPRTHHRSLRSFKRLPRTIGRQRSAEIILTCRQRGNARELEGKMNNQTMLFEQMVTSRIRDAGRKEGTEDHPSIRTYVQRYNQQKMVNENN